MGADSYAILILSAIFCAVWGHVEASGNIGNRAYSIWYETHFLVEKKGIFKLIYFKPRHFDRYTLYEVISFFASYFVIVAFAAIGVLHGIGLFPIKLLYAVCGSVVWVFFLAGFAVSLINDIGSHRDDKKKFYLEMGEREPIEPLPEALLEGESKLVVDVIRHVTEVRNQRYFTKYNLWDSYRVRLKAAKNDVLKRDRVNLDYIEYFRNMPHLVVIKENKSGSLQLKIKK